MAGEQVTDQEVATFQSAPTQTQPTDYTATIRWGDGTPDSSGQIATAVAGVPPTFSVTGTHTYATPGSYPFFVTIMENVDHTSVVVSGTATVTSPVPPPPDVTTGTATDVTQISAALHGTVDSHGQGATTYHFEYGSSAAYGRSTPLLPIPGGTAAGPRPVGQSLVNLTPASTYHYRLVADGPGGTAAGSDRTFITSAARPPATPGPVRVLNGIPTRAVAGRTVTFGLPVAAGELRAAYYLWDFGDGSKQSQPLAGVLYRHGVPTFKPRIAHRYKRPGAYNVVGQAVGRNGSITMVSTKVLVAPTAGARSPAPFWHGKGLPAIWVVGAGALRPGMPIEFSASSKFNYGGTIGINQVDYGNGRWDWGDHTQTVLAGSNNSTASHTYKVAGDYTVKFSVDSPADGTIEVQAQVSVKPLACGRFKLIYSGVPVNADGQCLGQLPDGGRVADSGVLDVAGFKVGVAGAVIGIRPVVYPATGVVTTWPPVSPTDKGGLSVSLDGHPLGLTRGFSIPLNGGDVPDVIGQHPFGAALQLDGFPIASGIMHLRDEPPGATVDITLPPPFHGSEPLNVGGAHAATAGDLTIGPFSAGYGPIEADDVTLTHDNTGWHGGGKLNLLGQRIEAPDDPAQQLGFGLNDDLSFAYAGAKFTPPVPIPFGTTPLELVSIGGKVRLNPFFLVEGDVSLGVPAGAAVATIQGCFAYAHIPANYGGGGRICSFNLGPSTQEDDVIRAEGQLSLVGGIDLGTGAIDFHSANGGSVDFGATLPSTTIVPGVVTVDGSVNGAFYFHPFQFEADGSVNVNFFGHRALSGNVYVTSKGIAACADLDLKLGTVSVGGEYNYANGFDWFAHGCDDRTTVHVQPAREIPAHGFGAAPLVSARPAAAVLRVPVRGAHRLAIISVKGLGGSPSVVVTGPKGERLLDTQSRVLGAGLGIVHADRLSSTYAFIAQPSSGTWTISANPGSPPLTDAVVSVSMPKPTIRAAVTGRSHTRVLHYRISPQAGQSVTFIEQASRTVVRTLGRARGTRGTLAFSPLPARAGKREIIALVAEDGSPRAKLTVASYLAPPPILPGRVGALRGRHVGTKLIVSWRAARDAAGYLVSATIGGRRILVTLDKHVRRFAVPRFYPIDSARVSVVAVGSDSRRGPKSTVGVRPSRRPSPLVI